MEHIAIGDIEPVRLGESQFRDLAGGLGTDGLALNRYRIAPDEGTAGGLHAHMDQEELFIVLEGVASVQTLEEEFDLRAGEAIRFERGEFHSCLNHSAEAVVVLAIGVPKESTDIRIPAECPACSHPDLRLHVRRDPLECSCTDCEALFLPQPCPDCDSEDLEMERLETGSVVAVCQSCGSDFSRPPLERRS